MASNGLDYHHLLCFETVAEEGSRRLASQILQVSHTQYQRINMSSESVIARLY
jgi:hypothetical protein